MMSNSRNALLLRTYGITAAQYDDLLNKQRGRCAVCGTLPKTTRLAVDHCHSTGLVRGLLCHRCNQAIAKFDDSVGKLDAAARYLRAAEKGWDSLTLDEQAAWLPYRGRANGKGRRARIAKVRKRLRQIPKLPENTDA